MEETPAPVDINAANEATALLFTISNATVRAYAGGRANLRYTVAGTRTSLRENLTIEGDVAQLPAPTVPSATAGSSTPNW